MARSLLFFFLFLFVLFTIINCKSECTCSCCKGNRCIPRYQGSIHLPTCSATSCKHTCKLRHPGHCGRSPGTTSATCTKTKTPHRKSPIKKIKQKLTPSSNKHLHHRP